MNFLGHAYLSGSDREILTGNFIGDFVKGKNYEKFPEKVATGILLHREIDHFTDQNEFVKKSKKRLWNNYGHFAGIIVDVFYDYFLVSNWKSYSSDNLNHFIDEVYLTLKRNYELLPFAMQRVLPHMVENNWLLNYGNIEGIRRSLNGMARRSKFETNMPEAIHELKIFNEAFNEEFNAFFPQVISHAAHFINI